MNKNEIVSKSNEILKRLGKPGIKSIGRDRDGDDILVGCTTYNLDKLSITSSLKIVYNGSCVFDIDSDFYKKGMWEELLNEIYNHIDKLEIIKREKEMSEEKARQFIETTIHDYEYLKGNAKGRCYEKLKNKRILINIEDEVIPLVIGSDRITTWEVKADRKVVLKSSQCNYGVISIYKFEEGEWMQEIANAIKETKEEVLAAKEMENNYSVQESIRKLKRL